MSSSSLPSTWNTKCNLSSSEFLCEPTENVRSQDSAVGIATGYGLDNQGVGVQVPVG
jgi:hypothetical protein